VRNSKVVKASFGSEEFSSFPFLWKTIAFVRLDIGTKGSCALLMRKGSDASFSCSPRAAMPGQRRSAPCRPREEARSSHTSVQSGGLSEVARALEPSSECRTRADAAVVFAGQPVGLLVGSRQIAPRASVRGCVPVLFRRRGPAHYPWGPRAAAFVDQGKRSANWVGARPRAAPYPAAIIVVGSWVRRASSLDARKRPTRDGPMGGGGAVAGGGTASSVSSADPCRPWNSKALPVTTVFRERTNEASVLVHRPRTPLMRSTSVCRVLFQRILARLPLAVAGDAVMIHGRFLSSSVQLWFPPCSRAHVPWSMLALLTAFAPL